MKVLYVGPFATTAFLQSERDTAAPLLGGVRKMELLMSALVAAGHQVVLLSSVMTTVSSWRIRPQRTESVKVDSGFVEVVYPAAWCKRPLGGLINALRAPLIIDEIVARHQPEVAIIYNSYLFEARAGRALSRRYGIPYWLEVEDLPTARNREFASIKPKIDALCWTSCVRSASAYSAVNSAILDRLPSNRRRHLLPGIVDSALMRMANHRSSPFTRKRKRLGYFGGLTAPKGVRVLVDLIPLLPSDWELWVTGAGPLAPEFEDLMARFPDRVKFLGRVHTDQLYTAMCNCDAAVIPREAVAGDAVFPFKVFEYIVANLHIISSTLPSMHEFDFGYVQRWDGLNAESLIRAMASAECDYISETSIRERLREQVLRRFTIPPIAQMCTDIVGAIAKPLQNYEM